MSSTINTRAGGTQRQLGFPVTAVSGNHNAPAADTAAVVTLAADANVPNILSQIFCSYTATPTGGAVTVADGGTTIFKQFLALAGPHQFTFSPPLCGTKNTAMTITLAAPGGTVVGILTVNAYKEV